MMTRLALAPLLFLAVTTACVGEGDPPIDTDVGDASTDDSTGDVANACPAPTGPGTDVPATLDTDATWTLEGSPYRIAATTTITADVTLEPCTVVQLAPDVRLFVGNDPLPGSLVAQGELDGITPRAVVFERLDPDAPWGAIEVEPTGFLDATVTRFVGGGSVDAGAAIFARGATPDGATTPNVRVDMVTVEDSTRHGIYLESRAAFTEDSSGLIVVGTGEDAFPVKVQAGAVHSLPPLELMENASDVVGIETFANIDDDTFPDRGAPYEIDDALYIGTMADDGESTLTIEPGVELRFAIDGAGSGIIVGFDALNEGRIVADGTADRPIAMRSAEAEPLAGDWMGLYFRNSPATGNVLSHVTIAHAGGTSGAQGFGCGPAENHASILLLTEDAMEPFFEDVTITDAGGDTQLVIGWLDGAPADTAQAFAEGLTFADAPACTVGLPRDTGNLCPGDAAPDCL